MSDHTELPELAVGYMDQGMGHGHYTVVDAKTNELLDVTGPHKDRIRLIVRACNSHKPLLKACKALMDDMSTMIQLVQNGHSLDSFNNDSYTRGATAIAKANKEN